MATFKAEVYAHQKKKDGTYNIKIRVTHNGEKRYLATPYFIYKEDITQKTFKIKNQHYIDLTDGMIRTYRKRLDRWGERQTSMTMEQIIRIILLPPTRTQRLPARPLWRQLPAIPPATQTTSPSSTTATTCRSDTKRSIR